MKDELLRLDRVRFAYEEGGFALRPLSLRIRQGEKIAVLGGNGAGKSTFFLLCNGVLSPDAGELALWGQAVRPRNKRDLSALREAVGIVFQDPNQQLIGPTVEAEISFGPMNLRLDREEVRARTDEALQAMGLQAHRHRPPQSLSGGEKKRVCIAGVLAMRPQAILFDEPTAFLDPAGAAVLEDILAQLERRGKTLLLSTHDVDFAWRWAERILVFSGGELIRDGTPEAIFSDGELLSRAGLRAPLLFEVADLLRRRGLLEERGAPRTLEGLERALKQPATQR